MKKKLLIGLSALLIITVSMATSFAFLTSEETEENIMTVGKVKIKQHEYERVVVNNEWVSFGTQDSNGFYPDKLQEFTQNKNIDPAYYMNNANDVMWDDRTGHSSENDPESYKQSWIQIGAPGSNQLYDDSVRNVVDKFVFVENTGIRSAYYRTIIAIECPIGFDETLIHLNTNNQGFTWTDAGKTYFNDTQYCLKVATYNEELKPDTISSPSLLQVYLDPKTSSNDVNLFKGQLEIFVYSQATTYSEQDKAEDILNKVFGEISSVNNPWVNGVKYIYNDEELVEFLKTGGKGILMEDIDIIKELDNSQVVISKTSSVDINLNTNGYTITNKSTTNSTSLYFMLFGQDSNVVLTGDGGIKVDEEAISGQNHMAIYASNNANVTIDGGNYTAMGSVRGLKNNIAIYASGNSIVTINDGSFYATGPQTSLIYLDSNAKIYINGGFFKSEGAAYGENLNIAASSTTGEIIISGGIFVNFDPSKEEVGTAANKTNRVKIAAGYKVEQRIQPNKDIWYVVVPA